MVVIMALVRAIAIRNNLRLVVGLDRSGAGDRVYFYAEASEGVYGFERYGADRGAAAAEWEGMLTRDEGSPGRQNHRYYCHRRCRFQCQHPRNSPFPLP